MHLAHSGIALYAVNQADRVTSDLTRLNILQKLASLTGGVWFPGDAAGAAIRQAVSAGAVTYRAGYLPLPGRWDGRFHELRDAVLRAGVEVTLDRPVAGGVRKVRIVVQDVRCGSVGSLTIPLNGAALRNR